ncbi:MAG: hypothetical protein RL264_67 [Bacteroidota bacterium]|jgi:hypothetical protein
MIELPKTIRPARFDEIPKNSTAFERLQMIDNAKIVEGYSFKLKESDNEEHKKIPFKFYSEININNSRLWDLIIALTDLLPDVSSLIIGDSDSEPNYCDYISKIDLIENLNKFRTELTKDAFLEWGIIYNDKEVLTEIFVPDSKYIKFWGVDIDGFKTIMTKFDLNQVDDLEFIDEYPKVREPLRLIENSIMDTNELINELKK